MVNGAEVLRNINMPIKTGTQAELDELIKEGLINPAAIANAPTDNILSLFQNSGAYDRDKRNTAVYSIFPEFIIIPKDLKAKIEFSYTTSNYEKLSSRPKFSRYENSWVTQTDMHMIHNNATETRNNDSRYMLNAFLTYDKTIAKHSFNLLAGFNQEMYKRTGLSATYNYLFSPTVIKPNAVEDQTRNRSTNSFYRTTARAFFGRLLYNYDSKYLFEFDMRYDGSSKFPKAERYQTFPTFSLGWRLTEEKFMDFSRNYLDNVKFRYSWGRLGTQPGDYEYMPNLVTQQAGWIFTGGRFPSTVVPGTLVNPNLTWEKSTTINYGIDITALKNRLDLSFELFSRKVTDLLILSTANFPNVLGANAPLANTGVLKTNGWEVSVKWNDRLSNGLRYGIGFHLTDGKTKVKSFEPNENFLLKDDQLYTGKRLGEIWGYQTGGILQESDFDGFANNKWTWNGTDHTNMWTNLAPGYVWLKDLDGNGIISDGKDFTLLDPGDMRVIGNDLPRYQYNINLTAEFKGVDLSLNFQGTGKRDYWLSHSSYWGGGMGTNYMYERSWTPDRTNAKYPMYGTGGGTNNKAHSGYLIDASYFKLQQAVIGYTLPQNLTRKIGMEKLKFTLAGYNIFSVTDIPAHYDPEMLSINYPQSRTIEVGVQVQF